MQFGNQLWFTRPNSERVATKFEYYKCGAAASSDMRNTYRKMVHRELSGWVSSVEGETGKPARLGTLVKKFKHRIGHGNEQIRDTYARLMIRSILDGTIREVKNTVEGNLLSPPRPSLENHYDVSDRSSKPPTNEVFTPFAALTTAEGLSYRDATMPPEFDTGMKDSMRQLTARLTDTQLAFDFRADLVVGAIVDLRLDDCRRKKLVVRLSDLTALISDDSRRLTFPEWLEAKFGVRNASLNWLLAVVLTRCALVGDWSSFEQGVTAARKTGEVQRRGEATYTPLQASDEALSVSTYQSLLEEVWGRLLQKSIFERS